MKKLNIYVGILLLVTQISFAADSSKLDLVIESLINNGVAVDAEYERSGYTFLTLATENRSTNLAVFLLEKGANVNLIDGNGFTPLGISIKDGNYNLAKLLLEKYNANPDIENEQRETPLIILSRQDNPDIELIKILLNKGVNLNAQDKDGNTALIECTKSSAKKCVELLVKHRADTNIKNNDGDTALTLISGKFVADFHTASLDVLSILIKHGADINAKDSEGQTPLIISANKLRERIAKMETLGLPRFDKSAYHTMGTLLKHKADINAQDDYGRTALMYTMESGDFNNSYLLLSNGAKKDIKDKNGETAADLAKANGHRMLLIKLFLNGY